MEESELVRRLKKGDRQAFDSLYELYKDKAFRTAACISGNRQDGEDIVQETFIQVYQHIGELKKEDGFKNWFYKILTRIAIKTAKRSSMEIPDEEAGEKMDRQAGEGLFPWQDAGMEEPAGRLLEEEQARWLRDRIRELDEKHRTVLVLYYYNEFSTQEIARLAGCLEGTVKSRLFAARKKLEKSLIAAGMYERRALHEGSKEPEPGGRFREAARTAVRVE